MKKYLLLLVVIISFNVYSQSNLPAPQNGSTHNTSLPTGGFSASIPLFNLPTSNANFNLDAQLTFNSAAALSDNPKSNLLVKGWEFGFIPSINKILMGSQIEDEHYYRRIKEKIDGGVTPVSEISISAPDQNIYSFEVFGLQGKFYFSEINQQIWLLNMHSSDYVDIKANYTFTHPVSLYFNGKPATLNSNTHFNVTSFEITDKNGYTYVFSVIHKDKASYRENRFGNSYDVYYDYKSSFLIKEVKDRFGTTLLEYSYTDVTQTYTNTNGTTQTYTQKKLTGIDVKNTATVTFAHNTPQSMYTNILVKNKRNETIHNIDLNYGSVVFKDAANVEVQRASYTTSALSGGYFSITQPYGGKTTYLMEGNDYSYLLSMNGSLQAASTPFTKTSRTGLRIQSIIEYDKDNKVVNEQYFKYLMGNNPNESSGIKPIIISGDPESMAQHHQIPNLKGVYKRVTVEVPGLGKTVHTFDLSKITDSRGYTYATNLNNVPTEIAQYSESGELMGKTETATTRYFGGLHPDTNYPYHNTLMIEGINRKITEYAAVGKSMELETATVLDRLTKNVVSETITDNANGEEFTEEKTYIKKGNTYFPETVQKLKNGTVLNRTHFEYLPYNGSTQIFNLSKVMTAKGSQPYEVDKEITLYDDWGNVLEYKTKEGIYVSQIWGYNNTKVIAELKNATYASIAVSTVNALKTNSNAATYNETTLVSQQTSLRNAFPQAFVTTYTYRPLVGLTSVTDVNGVKESYQYDSFNRLYRVLNNDELIIKEYSYNIKNQ